MPKFDNEAEEAEWWYQQRHRLTDEAEASETRGDLRLRRLPASETKPAKNITIRLLEQDLARARELASKRGLRYQTYLKMLLHEALQAEEKKLA